MYIGGGVGDHDRGETLLVLAASRLGQVKDILRSLSPLPFSHFYWNTMNLLASRITVLLGVGRSPANPKHESGAFPGLAGPPLLEDFAMQGLL